MSLIILSALGTGQYREATYKSEYHAQTITTGLFAVALKDWYPDAVVKLLATDGAWNKKAGNGEYVRDHHPEFERVRIPDGRTEAEAWEIFQAVADAVPAGSRVIFDITHGLRSLPMLEFLALSYLKVVKNVQIERVFYGALELTPREEGALTPVVDLTPLVSLLDWAQAANRFQDTGDASLFKTLLEMKQKADYNAVSRQLEVLSRNIAGNRGRNIPTEAAKLIRVLETAQQGTLEQRQRPFALVMQQLEEQMRPLAAPDDDDKLRLEAEYALICWYAERGHYPQAMSLAREWLISVRQWHELGRVSMETKERDKMNVDVWKAVDALAKGKGAEGETDFSEDADGFPQYPGLAQTYHAYAYITDRVSKSRNDLMHFGFKEEPATAAKSQGRAASALSRLAAAVRPLGLELPAFTPRAQEQRS